MGLINKFRPVNETFKYFIITGQIFGFFPVENVCSSEIKHLRFTWISLKTISSIITCLLGLCNVILVIRHIFTNGFDHLDMKFFLLNVSGTAICILFMRVARQWPSFVQKWTAIDEAAYLYEVPNSCKKMATLTFIIVISQIAVTVIFEVSDLWVAFGCKHSTWESFEYYSVRIRFSQAFAVIPYSPWITALLQVLNTRMLFALVYSDLFIVMISISLGDRYRMINVRMQRMCNLKVNIECLWRNIRETYSRTKHLTSLVNELIGSIVVISFASNSYFIITELFDSLREKETLIQRIGFYLSFAMIISRTIILCHYCGMVYEEARKPLRILLTLPYTIYNKEIERVIESACQANAITGLGFFSVSRGLILKIASAIVTYELIMIQFNRKYLKMKSIDTSC